MPRYASTALGVKKRPAARRTGPMVWPFQIEHRSSQLHPLANRYLDRLRLDRGRRGRRGRLDEAQSTKPGLLQSTVGSEQLAGDPVGSNHPPGAVNTVRIAAVFPTHLFHRRPSAFSRLVELPDRATGINCPRITHRHAHATTVRAHSAHA